MLILAIQIGGLDLLACLLWFLVFVWFVSSLLTLYGLSRQTTLSPVNDIRSRSDDTPLVSILVPARNEQHRVLKDSIGSILAQDYGRFEVVAVDDRSTDATGAILRSLAKSDHRLQVVEGAALPADWLGKPHAMQQAFNRSRGEWILATDADMIFNKAALRTALANISAQNADAITLIPYFQTGSFWERVMIPTWAWVMLMFTVSYRINNPKTRRALGIGGFFLIRRELLERVGGYERLRDEVMEDVRLAELIKQSRARLLTAYAPDLLQTRMYQNFSEMWESCTKTWFSGMRFSLLFAVLCVLWMYLIAITPPVVAVVSLIGVTTGFEAHLWRLFIPAALSWLMQVAVLMKLSIRSGVSPVYSFTAPLGLALLYTMLLDSSIRITTGKGVKWKGRVIYHRTGVPPPDLGAAACHSLSRSKQ